MILLMLDFDGTLAPIKSRPEGARLGPGARRLLGSLGRDPQFRLAVISGRALGDVRRRVGIGGITYAGCHGLEMRGPGWSYLHPRAAKMRNRLVQAARELARELKKVRGVLVEDKGLAVAVHFRKAGPGGAGAAARAVSRVLSKHKGKLKPGRGRKVLELLPDVSWDKGSAARLLISRFGGRNACPVYIGDDLTDEPAFRAVRGRGLGILVESRERPGRSAAAVRFGSTRQVLLFLRSLAALGIRR